MKIKNKTKCWVAFQNRYNKSISQGKKILDKKKFGKAFFVDAALYWHRDTSRFALDIQAIPALKEISKFPIISDPSHASFWAPWVPSLTYA